MRLLITGGSGFIGTNLIEAAIQAGAEVVNLDIAAPLDDRHRSYWKRCDVLDIDKMHSLFRDFRPTAIVHLAARTDTTTDDPLEEYPQNTTGTANLLAVTNDIGGVQRLIVTSTQFVCRPGYEPVDAKDYAPHTVYGQSKVVTEQLTRSADLRCTWTIIRPTTIWGPWCLRYLEGFFPALRRRLYVHPGTKPCIRSYGFVGNVASQILGILAAKEEVVSGRTLYVGDRPINLLDWVNGFSSQFTGKSVRVVPRPLVRILAFGGDIIAGIGGGKFPITSSRFRSMTEDYIVDMEPTIDLLGDPPDSLSEGIAATIRWLQEYEKTAE